MDRKIAKLREEGRDPSLPQKPEPVHQHLPSNTQSIPGDFPRSAPSPPPNRPMSDSQNTVDESFMILGGQRVSFTSSSLEPPRSYRYCHSVRPWRCIQSVLEYHARNVGQPVTTRRICYCPTRRRRIRCRCNADCKRSTKSPTEGWK